MEINGLSISSPPQAPSESAQNRLERIQNISRPNETDNSNNTQRADSASNDPSVRPTTAPNQNQQAQALIEQAREAQSNQRRDESPAQRLENQIQDLLGNPDSLEAQIDEFI